MQGLSKRVRLACVSAAEHMGLALLERPVETHLWAPPSAHVPLVAGARFHRSIPLAPPGATTESIADVLFHVAKCLPHVEALIVWESALRRRHLSRGELRRIRWRGDIARTLAGEAGALSDSLIETIATDALRHAGIPFRQQVPVLGHRVDILVGSSLVIQLDGHAFHAGAAQRSIDAAHDARIALDGGTVLRFTYADAVRAPQRLVALVVRAMAQGRHLVELR